MPKLTFATIVVAIVAATIASASAPAARAPTVANIAAQDWCSGPRQHTDYRCFQTQ